MDNCSGGAVQETEKTYELEPREYLAGKLIDVWCANHAGRISWSKCIQITAIVTRMPDDERDRLLNME